MKIVLFLTGINLVCCQKHMSPVPQTLDDDVSSAFDVRILELEGLVQQLQVSVEGQQHQSHQTCQDQHELYRQLQQEFQDQQKRLQRLQNSYEDLQDSHQQLQENHRTYTSQEDMRRTSNVDVAFSVYANTYDRFVLFEPGDTIPFLEVEYNSGGFNLTDSKYYCPVDGLYWFNVNIYSQLSADVGHTSAVEILKGGSNQLALLFTATGPSESEASLRASNSVITECSEGETIHVQAVHNSYIFGDEYYRHTTFNGMLIKK